MSSSSGDGDGPRKEARPRARGLRVRSVQRMRLRAARRRPAAADVPRQVPDRPSPGLVEKLLGPRNERAWTQLVLEYEPLIVRVLIRHSGADIETVADLKQKLLLRLIEDGGRRLEVLRGQGDAALRSFLFTSALHAARDHLRRTAVRAVVRSLDPEELRELTVVAPDDPEKTVDDSRRVQQLLRALEATAGRFPDRDVMIFRAYHLDGYTASEIATMGHGLGPKGVEALVRRMRLRLLEWIRSQDPGDLP